MTTGNLIFARLFKSAVAISVMLLALALIPAAGSAAEAPASAIATDETALHKNFIKSLGTDEVKAGAYLANVKKLDIQAGTWTADFYVWFVWRDGALDPSYEIVNGNHDFKDAPVVDTIEIEGVGYRWLTYRISATLSCNFNFRRYPLDVQTLTLALEDRVLNTSLLNYAVFTQECSLDSAVNISGWEIAEKFVNVENHRYSTSFGGFSNDVYSRLVFGIKIARPRFSSILKIMLPLTIILSLAFLAFALSPDKFSQRISLGISTVFTSVAFHINLSSALPPVSYLTLVDRVMISTYFVLFMSLISTIYTTKCVDAGRMDLAVAANRRLAAFVAAIALVLISSQFLF